MDLIIQAIYEHIIILVDYLLINTRETCYKSLPLILLVFSIVNVTHEISSKNLNI